MTQSMHTSLNVDVSRIENAEVRRAVRQLVQQLQETIAQQQIEIEALLELMLEKHVASQSEFRRHVQRIQQHAAERAERVAAVHGHVPHHPVERPKPAAVAPRDVDVPELEGRQVYRLDG